jgi:adenylate cyclase
VGYILEGSIRKAGNRARVTGQLIDAITGAHIWADRVEGDLDDIFALQDRITQSVVAAIEPNLRAAETKRTQRKPTNNLDAYDLYLRALPEFDAFTEDGFRRSEALLRRALQLDPNYSEALAALADCIGRMTVGSWISDWRTGGAQARDIALQAVRADPENGTALSIAAWAMGILTGPIEQAAELAHHALRFHPNSALVRTNCGWVFVYNGESELALEHLHVARRISPLDPRGYVTMNGIAAAHFFGRRFDEAVQWARRALQENPTLHVSLRFLSAALVHLGRKEDAQDTIRELLRIQPNASLSRWRSGPMTHRYNWMREMFIEGLKAAGLPE